MQDNIPAVIQVMRFIYDNIMYAELNTKSDYCQECGYTGEIQIVEDEHKKAHLEMSEMRLHRSEQIKRRKAYLRLHWHSVLESGTDAGN